jgi:glycosyltransferase involved in cell wall biosynthesis
MRIVLIGHPLSLGSQSMPRFSNMLEEGMKARGHSVEVWNPSLYLYTLPVGKMKKWLGYIDQYLVFPLVASARIRNSPSDTLFVVTDHALGPYVPLVANKNHVIHCHDFLAQRSALGEIAENPTSLTGRKYQSFIRKGYSKGKNFISVSEKTRTDLKEFLGRQPELSEVVYNGINETFTPLPVVSSRATFGKQVGLDLSAGYLLHVGGNQWYKNRAGIISLYDKWKVRYQTALPLLLVGEAPSAEVLDAYETSAYKHDIHFLTKVSDKSICMAYAGAAAFLFPSLAEGFGWPIAEAMASGTLVLTTNEAPMTEVAGDAAFLIERMPMDKSLRESWATDSAAVLQNCLNLSEQDREKAIEKGFKNVARFDLEIALNEIESIYKAILVPSSNLISLP